MAHDPLDIAGIEDELQDEERLVRDSVARFVDDEVLPIIGRCFAEHSFPRELIAPMARLGLLGSSLEGYGCAGLNAVSYGLICRELERGDSALRSFVSVQSSLCMFPIYTYGSPEQRERWLPGMARGEIIGCFGLTEAHGGSDPLNMNTTAKRQGGDWVLNGSKMWITNAPLADVAIVWALTDEGVRGAPREAVSRAAGGWCAASGASGGGAAASGAASGAGSAPARTERNTPQMLALLDAAEQSLVDGRCDTYYREHLSPELRRTLGARTVDTLISACTRSMGNRELLVAALRIVRRTAPAYEAGGNRAVYDVSAQGLPYDRFVLERIDGRWYIGE